jgi:hypothetical protein
MTRPARWDYPPPAANDQFGAHCHSFPHCSEDHLPGERFCQFHQNLLNRVRASLDPRYRKRSPTIAGLKPAEPPPVEPKAEPWVGRGLTFQNEIIAALQAGSRTSNQLAEACNTTVHDKSFSRARQALEQAGKVIDLGRQGREYLYSLRPPAAFAKAVSETRPARTAESPSVGRGSHALEV